MEIGETRIRVLIWANFLAVYAIWVLMTYLTEVWKLSVTHAAGILNILGGIVLTLPLGFAYPVDAVLGNYKVLAFSSIAYSIGLGFLSMSTPPVLSNSTGTCSKYEPECIGHTQKVLFYTALALIAIGISGHIVSLKPFIQKQRESKSDVEQGRRESDVQESKTKTVVKNDKNKMVPRFKIRELVIALFTVVGGIALPYIKPWSVRFGIPAICTLVATIVFLSSSCFYNRDGPEGSPITNIFRVIVASASNISKQLPSDSKELYEGDNRARDLLPHTDRLRCLDKAAIKLSNQEGNSWRLCTVTEVEETKIAIRMIPMWMTFIICGLVSSAGTTYFQEQANHLSRKVGKLKVPLPILLVLQECAKSVFSFIYQKLKEHLEIIGLEKYAPSVGIAGAMIFATLSCITAAKVEARRLDVIRSHDLIEKPEETIPMNIFWVLPQFLLLGGLDSFFAKSVTDFYRHQSPPSMAKYVDYFTKGVSGLGFMASVLSTYVVGKISEHGGKPNWFQNTLNKSRLDNYFWILSALCAVNFVVYILVASFYPYREERLETDGFGEGNGNNF